MVEKSAVDLSGRTVYVPQMSRGGAKAFSAAFRSIGIDAWPLPDSDHVTLALGTRYISGDECYPETVTLGDMLKVIESPDFRPEKTAFFMPTAQGPCRFGQYAPFLRKVLRDVGKDGAIIVSPTSANGYAGIGENSRDLIRTAWRALVAADILRKMLLKTRPYERHKGETESVYEECLDDVCAVIEKRYPDHDGRLQAIAASLTGARDRFRRIPAEYTPGFPLIGVVGEIFCRLNRFSNENLVLKLEEYGAECWLSDVAEWVWYTNFETKRILRLRGRTFSRDMLGAKIKEHFQRKDEAVLMAPFKEEFAGYEEPHDIREVIHHAEPYLPAGKVLGEMVLSMGKSVYLYHKGADGIVDISPFSCMNGIASEAVFPALSRDCDRMPVRNFFFDGTAQDLDRDVGIFVELARNYQRRKRNERIYPAYFQSALSHQTAAVEGGR